MKFITEYIKEGFFDNVGSQKSAEGMKAFENFKRVLYKYAYREKGSNQEAAAFAVKKSIYQVLANALKKFPIGTGFEYDIAPLGNSVAKHKKYIKSDEYTWINRLGSIVSDYDVYMSFDICDDYPMIRDSFKYVDTL